MPPEDPSPEALERIVERARSLDGGVEAVIATDRYGTILYWSRSAEKLYGWPADEVLGRGILQVTPSEGSRLQAEEIMRHLASGASWHGTFEVCTREGSILSATVRDIPVRDPLGELVGVIGVSRPIDPSSGSGGG